MHMLSLNLISMLNLITDQQESGMDGNGRYWWQQFDNIQLECFIIRH